MTRGTEKHRIGATVPDATALRGFFDRTGPWFYSVFFTSVGYRSSLKYFLRLHHPRLGLREGMTILDAGIGTGFLTGHLLGESPIPLTVMGLDFSAGMLVGLRRRLKGIGLDERVRLHVGDMRRMPFPDGSFDLVMTSAAMEYLPEVGEGISECARVLRPGGKLLFIATRDTFMGKIVAATWRNKILTMTHVRECMEHAGLNRIETLRFPWYFPHINWWGMAFLAEKGG